MSLKTMKSIITIFLLVLSTIFCTSCKKDAVAVKGDWKWIYADQGGFAGGIIKPSNGATVSLSLNSDLTYTMYLNNQINAQGLYSITSSSGISTINFDKIISADKLFLEKEEGIYETNDSLFLINNHFEGSPPSVFLKAK